MKLKKQETNGVEGLKEDTGEGQRSKGRSKKLHHDRNKGNEGSVRTHAAGFIARPLVIVLAGDGPLSHQLKGRLTGEGQSVVVLEAIAAATAECWHTGVSAPPSFDLCNTGDRQPRLGGWS